MPGEELIHLRTSERRSFKRCPKRWWWSNVEGLAPTKPSMALWFGSGIHEALAEYYQRGVVRHASQALEVWEAWCDEGDADGEFLPADEMGEEWVEARALGLQMLMGYHERFGGDPDWDVVATEQSFQVTVRLDDGSIVEYDGTFDGVYRSKSSGKFRLMEHKTCKAMPNFSHLVLDDQAGSYWAVAPTILRHQGIFGARDRLWGITYNYLRKALPDDRPQNADGHYTNKPVKADYIAALQENGIGFVESSAAKGGPVALDKATLKDLASAASFAQLEVLGEVSKNQPPPLFERRDIRRTTSERRTQVQRIKDEALSMNAMRSGRLPLYKNPTMDCSWDCAFFDLCSLDEQGDSEGADEFKQKVYRVVDPYAAHRNRKSA